MMLKLKLWSTMLLMMIACECLAIPADPTPRKIKQPDGTFVTLRIHGDEYLNYTTTADGFTVVKDGRGFWVYARKQADGTLAATSVVAHDEAGRTEEEKAFLSSTPRRIMPKMDSGMAAMRQSDRVRRTKAQEQHRAAKYDYSNFRGLIVLVEFNDRSFMYGDEMNSIMNDIANKENYKGDSRTNYVNEEIGLDLQYYGSISDYFRDNSNGIFVPKFDVVGPVKVNRSQYFANDGNNSKQLIREALDAVDPQVDFSQYDRDNDGQVDMVYFLFAGMGSHYPGTDPRLIWPHQGVIYDEADGAYYYVIKDGVRLWDYACSVEMQFDDDLPALSGIGVFCHEFSHVLGLKDFYDTDYGESGGESAHPASWSLMGSGNYLNYGYFPCGYSLYERYLVGFCEQPTVLSKTGTYSMHEVSTNEGYWLNSPDMGEFFIIENRQQTGWDTYLLGHGMMVYRVDRSDMAIWDHNLINISPDHMYYEPLFAGGAQGGISPYDPFPGEGNVTAITNNSSPANLRTWGGKDCMYSLAHITETDGVITFDVVDASTFEEIIMPKPQDMYEGICYHLNPTIYMPTTSYRTNWKSDNPDVATVDKQGNVTAVAEGTAHITLTIDKASATYDVTVVPANVVPQFDNLFNYPTKTEQVVQLNNAQVFFVEKTDSRDWIFIRDGTRSILLKGLNIDAEPGDVLNGRIYALYQDETEWLSLKPLDGINYEGSIQITPGPTPKPDVVTADNLNSVHVMDYISMKGVTLGYKSIYSPTILCVLVGEKIIHLYPNYFTIHSTEPSAAEVEGKLYDLDIIVSYLNNSGHVDEFFLTAPLTLSESTGIDQLDAPLPQKARMYNLQGQRISSLQKGMNIVDGKKVFIP